MPIIERWLEFLNRMQVPYSHSTHPRAWTAAETADRERIYAREFAKTVVYFSENGFGMAVVPADQMVDLGRLSKVLDLAYVRIANETELARISHSE